MKRFHPGLLLLLFAVFGAVVVGIFLIANEIVTGVGDQIDHAPARSALIGEWAHKGSDARIALFADGHAVVTGVPEALLQGNVDDPQPILGWGAVPQSFTAKWSWPKYDEADAVVLFGNGSEAFVNGGSGSKTTIDFYYRASFERDYSFTRVSTIPTGASTPTPTPAR